MDGANRTDNSGNESRIFSNFKAVHIPSGFLLYYVNIDSLQKRRPIAVIHLAVWLYIIDTIAKAYTCGSRIRRKRKSYTSSFGLATSITANGNVLQKHS